MPHKSKSATPDTTVQALLNQINQVDTTEAAPFLPVDDPAFLKCSNALQPLLNQESDYRDTESRRLSLPSSVLPPPL